MRDALEELVGSMTDKAAFQEWTPRQVKAMDEARAALAARSEPLEIVRRDDLEPGSDPEHDFDGPDPFARSEPGAEGLDVERLSEAMASCDGVNWPKRWTTNESRDLSWVARQVAAKYAALAETEPKP